MRADQRSAHATDSFDLSSREIGKMNSGYLWAFIGIGVGEPPQTPGATGMDFTELIRG
jgi:hypothetical protein